MSLRRRAGRNIGGLSTGPSSLKENADAWGWENLLWFGMGQKIRKGEWDPDKDPVPASLQKMLDYGKSKNIKFISYSYPSLAFKQDPLWTKWAGDKVGGYSGADTGLRGFQDWWVDKLVSFVKKTGAGGFSFDHWWIAYEDPKATSKYAQWFGCRRVLETLRRRVPDIVIDGRAVDLKKAYNSIYGYSPKRTFLRFYADIKSNMGPFRFNAFEFLYKGVIYKEVKDGR